MGELSKVCSQIVLKFLYLARIGRPDILWSFNKLARAVTKTISDNFVMWETMHSIVDWVCFKTQTLLAILRTQKSTSGGVLCIFGSRTFVLVSWMCKKQTAVSHSSAESEIISLYAGFRMDGLLALDFWDVVIEVLRSSNNNVQPTHKHSGNWCYSSFQNQGPESQKKTEG